MYGSVENSIVEISYNVRFSIIIILKEVFHEIFDLHVHDSNPLRPLINNNLRIKLHAAESELNTKQVSGSF